MRHTVHILRIKNVNYIAVPGLASPRASLGSFTDFYRHKIGDRMTKLKHIAVFGYDADEFEKWCYENIDKMSKRPAKTRVTENDMQKLLRAQRHISRKYSRRRPRETMIEG